MSEKEIDHELTQEITCPYCGYEDHGSWEENDDGDMECPECYKEFSFERIITVEYSTKKKKLD